jgi:hypothetical protein
LHKDLPYTGAEVVWAARHEMARTVEDVLARRTRALFLNAGPRLAMARGWRHCSRASSAAYAAWQAAEVETIRRVAAGYVAAEPAARASACAGPSARSTPPRPRGTTSTPFTCWSVPDRDDASTRSSRYSEAAIARMPLNSRSTRA